MLQKKKIYIFDIKILSVFQVSSVVESEKNCELKYFSYEKDQA